MTPPLGEPVIEVVPPVDLYVIGYSPANGWCETCRHYRRYRDFECVVCCAPFTTEDRPGNGLRSVNRGRHKRATRALAAALRTVYPATTFVDWLQPEPPPRTLRLYSSGPAVPDILPATVPAPMRGNIAT